MEREFQPAAVLVVPCHIVLRLVVFAEVAIYAKRNIYKVGEVICSGAENHRAKIGVIYVVKRL